MSTNIVVISGNLGADPEMRYTATGKPVTEFSVAINERSGDKQTTHWIKVTAWDKTAEMVAEIARKGSLVLVNGRLTNDSWTDRDGKKQTRTKIVAHSVQVLTGRTVPTQTRREDEQEQDLSDLPF